MGIGREWHWIGALDAGSYYTARWLDQGEKVIMFCFGGVKAHCMRGAKLALVL